MHGPRLGATALICLLLSGALSIPARAQEQAPNGSVRLDLERFRPAPDGSGTWSIGDPVPLELGQYALSLTLNEAFSPLVLERATGERTVLVDNRLGASLGGLVGVGGPFSVGLQIPLVLYQGGSLTSLPPSTQPVAGGALGAFAFGDLRVSPRVALLRERERGVDLGLEASLVLPTGSSEFLAGDGGVGGTFAVTAARSLFGARLLGQLSLRFRPDASLMRMNAGHELGVRAGATWPLPVRVLPGMPIELLGEIDTSTVLTAPFDGLSSPGEWRVGARMCVMPGLSASLGAGGGLTRAWGTPFARGLLAVAWEPRACAALPDRDGDGVLDVDDECPDEKGLIGLRGCPAPAPAADEDNDGVPDDIDRCVGVPGDRALFGCPPPPDQDGDGVADADDHCPAVPGPAQFHGCPPDADGDQVPDDVDLCPNEPGPAELDGCPVRDTDGDGIEDALDRCPNEPGEAGRGGCPVRDADGDGVEDALDRCPNEPGEKERMGCPYRDLDQDGVADDEDNCPGEKGTAANHGCRTRQLVALRLTRIELLQKVSFRADAALDPKSSAVLDNLAAVLRAHPELPRVRVEAHVDNRGDAAANLELTRRQAQAVVVELLRRGVPAGRLEAVGRGHESPIAPNATMRGREANRRIELHIAEGPAPLPPAAPAAAPRVPAATNEVDLLPLEELPGLDVPPPSPPAPVEQPAPAAGPASAEEPAPARPAAPAPPTQGFALPVDPTASIDDFDLPLDLPLPLLDDELPLPE